MTEEQRRNANKQYFEEVKNYYITHGMAPSEDGIERFDVAFLKKYLTCDINKFEKICSILKRKNKIVYSEAKSPIIIDRELLNELCENLGVEDYCSLRQLTYIDIQDKKNNSMKYDITFLRNFLFSNLDIFPNLKGIVLYSDRILVNYDTITKICSYYNVKDYLELKQSFYEKTLIQRVQNNIEQENNELTEEEITEKCSKKHYLGYKKLNKE